MKTLKWIKFKSRLIFASLIMMVCDYIETTLYNWKYISTWVSSNIYYKNTMKTWVDMGWEDVMPKVLKYMFITKSTSNCVYNIPTIIVI